MPRMWVGSLEQKEKQLGILFWMLYLQEEIIHILIYLDKFMNKYK